LEPVDRKVFAGDLIESSADRLALELAGGSGGVGKRPITGGVTKLSLPLSGQCGDYVKNALLVIGRTELSYLKSLKPDNREQILRELFGLEPPALVVAGYRPTMDSVADELAAEADRKSVPLILSPVETSRCIRVLVKTLEETVARQVSLHGVLVDVMDVGVLILGPSGIGKSECALELVVRGHRLVADDVVVIRKLSDDRLVGSGSEMIRYHMEIRGLGILNVKDMFGISAIKARKTLDLVVELVRWNEGESYDRLGIEDRTYEIAGVGLPFVQMPVTPGRNIAVIVEVAARNHALKMQGTNAATALDRKLSNRLTRTGGRGA
jgi:HPr kinase/phosphorylase